jgi:hypothetical protein
MDNNNVDKQFTPLRNGEVISVNEIGQFLISHSTFRVEEFTSVLKEEIVKNKIGGGDQEKLVWFSEDGLSCEVLRFNSQGWQKGKVRISLEFCPDDSAETINLAPSESAATKAKATPSVVPALEEEATELAEDEDTDNGGDDDVDSFYDNFGEESDDGMFGETAEDDDFFSEDKDNEDDRDEELEISFETESHGDNGDDGDDLELTDSDDDNEMDLSFDTSFGDGEEQDGDFDEVLLMDESPVIESSGDLDNLPPDTDFDLGTDIGSVFGDDSLGDSGGDDENDMVGDVWDDLE